MLKTTPLTVGELGANQKKWINRFHTPPSTPLKKKDK